MAPKTTTRDAVPQQPRSPRGLAGAIALPCRHLRDAVLAALQIPGFALAAAEWRRDLFADADDATFADAYAQTITHALLMTHLAAAQVPAHGLLARALATLPRAELLLPLQQLGRTIAALDPWPLATRGDDPWTYFYEDFLAAYDPRLRNDTGAYYTPVEVVQIQVRLVEHLLIHHFNKAQAFADASVITLDPACGTGTYPSLIIRETLARLPPDRAPAAATRLAANVLAFERMPGPCAVAQLRLGELLLGAGATLPPDGLRVFPCDTLSSEHERTNELVRGHMLVCIGNPPYDRQHIDLADHGRTDRRGGWVRHGDPAHATPPLLADFLPAKSSGAGVHAKNLYNDYIYFWRWALHKVFEQSHQGGIVAFVTASSYLRGPGFVGMRRHMRRLLDELWILDLGGDSLGSRKSANVFTIRTPVCLAFAVRRGQPSDRPAAVWYTRLPDTLTREQKLAVLRDARSFADFDNWTRAPDDPEAPFIPDSSGSYAAWPRLTDLFPWQHSGAQWKRTWPIAETRELLALRWQTLLNSSDRRLLIKETPDRTIDHPAPSLFDDTELPPLATLPPGAPPPEIVRYAWRSFDRRWCLADARLGDRLRPPLWRSFGPRQVFLTSQLTAQISSGPALLACAAVPDLHHYAGRGGADIIPMWRDPAATQPNITAGTLEYLGRTFATPVSPADLFDYVYGCLAHPGYTAALADELVVPGPRVPLTKDPALFLKLAEIGRELLAWHTYRADLHGAARCLAPISGEHYPESFSYDSSAQHLHIGDARIGPVPADIWRYEVSGLRVVPSWLGYRMKKPRGRSSSPLDALRPRVWDDTLTRELLELLWALEHSLALHREQAALFARVLAGDLFSAAELPAPTPGERRPPR